MILKSDFTVIALETTVLFKKIILIFFLIIISKKYIFLGLITDPVREKK